jgi:hypothetical protein
MGLLISACANAMKPLETFDVPELDRWSQERPWSVIDGREVDNHPPPVSEFPTSGDYYELCDSVGVDRDSPIGFVVFNAVFTTDSEDRITGVTNHCLNPNLFASVEGEHMVELKRVFAALRSSKLAERYPGVHQWVEDVTRDATQSDFSFEGPRLRSPYEVPVTILTRYAYPEDSFGLRYWQDLVQEAVKFNFPESDPTRTLLLEHTWMRNPDLPASTFYWFHPYYDYRKTFDPETLAELKDGLLHYANDLKYMLKYKDRTVDVRDPATSACVNTISPLATLDDTLELQAWSDRYHNVVESTRVPDGAKFESGHLPVPEFPTSEDYRQFCDALGYKCSHLFPLMLFKELFVTDSEDCIIGVTNNLSSANVQSSINSDDFAPIRQALEAVRLDNSLVKYPKLRPWVESVELEVSTVNWGHTSVRRAFGGPHFGVGLYPVVTPSGYKPYYRSVLFRQAVEYNFGEEDPTRALLLVCAPLEQEISPSDQFRWYKRGFRYDFTRSFDPEFLAELKPGLLAYVADLKRLLWRECRI